MDELQELIQHKTFFGEFNCASYCFTAAGVVVLASALWGWKFRKQKLLDGNILAVLIAPQFMPFEIRTSTFVTQEATVIDLCALYRRQQLTVYQVRISKNYEY